jgi:hypothetical protein
MAEWNAPAGATNARRGSSVSAMCRWRLARVAEFMQPVHARRERRQGAAICGADRPRAGEVSGMTWAEVDLRGEAFGQSLAPEMKGGRQNRAPLSSKRGRRSARVVCARSATCFRQQAPAGRSPTRRCWN